MRITQLGCLRISLRMLIACVTIVCIGLGLAAEYFRRAQRQSADIAALKEIAVVFYDFQTEIDSDGSLRPPHALERPTWEPKEMFHKVTFLRATDRLDQDDLDLTWRSLGRFPHLKSAVVSAGDADHSNGLGNLRRVRDLRSLSVMFGKAENADWSPLADLRELRALDLSVNIDDKAVGHLRRLPHLQYLSVRGPAITDEGLKVVGELKSLQSLDLYDVDVTNRGLHSLSNLKQLQVLTIWSGSYGDQGLQAVAMLPGLTELSARNSKVTDDGLVALSALANLTDLNLRETQITDQGLKHLCKLQRLESLFLNGTRITDQGIAQLVTIPTLRLIDCGDTSVTAAGAAEVKKTLPNCSVWHDQPPSEPEDPTAK